MQIFFAINRSVRAKHFLIHEDGVVKLSGLRNLTSMIEEGSRIKVIEVCVMYDISNTL